MRLTNESYTDAKILEQIEVAGMTFLVVAQRFGGQDSATHKALLRKDRVAVALGVNNGGGYPDYLGKLKEFVAKNGAEALRQKVRRYDPPVRPEEQLLLPPEAATGYVNGDYE